MQLNAINLLISDKNDSNVAKQFVYHAKLSIDSETTIIRLWPSSTTAGRGCGESELNGSVILSLLLLIY